MNMKPLVASAAFALLSAGGLLAQGFNVRPGSWEFTITLQGDLPKDIPPAMRAQLEAEMRKPQVFTSCIKPEDLKSLNLGRSESGDEECKTLTSKITATSADVTRQCAGDEPYTETAHFEAPTPQTLRGTASRKGADVASSIAMTGRWVAAQCTD